MQKRQKWNESNGTYHHMCFDDKIRLIFVVVQKRNEHFQYENNINKQRIKMATN